MIEVIRFVLIGLGIGAIYGLIAQGLVLVFRGSGVLNFAHGAFVMVGAYAHYEFMERHGLPAVVSILLSMLVGALVGALTHLLILRPMRKSSPLTRVVATLGVLITLQSAAVLRYGVDIKSVPSSLPTDRVEFLDGAPVGLDRMLLLAIGVVTMLVLWAVYRYTRFGRITSAVAENQRAAATLGHSPDVIATGNWALGGALAALAGCLIAPITFLQPTSLSLLIIPALAAGLIAGFSSFPIALAGALAIGIAESLMGRYVQEPGWGASVPFIAVILVLVIRGRGLPLRSHVLDRLPVVGSGKVRPVPTLVLFLVMTLLLLQLFPVRWVDAFSVTMIFVILCMSVVVVTGLAGQLSLCQYVLAGVGALTAARLSASWGWSFPLAIGGAMAVTMALGAVVALPALRTRGLNLAIVTFGMATVIYALVLNNSEYTGGDTGIRVEPPTFLGWSIDPIRHPERYSFIILSTLFLAALVVCNIRRGTVGRRLIAVRSNERAAAAAGVNVYSAKVYAFVVASALASVAGVLSSFRNANVLAGSFSVFPSINIVAMTVVGGVGSVGGAVFGATLLQGGVGSELLRNFHGIEKYLPLAGGLLLLHILRTDQNGLFSMNVHLAKQVAKPFVTLFRKARRSVITSDVESEPGARSRCNDSRDGHPAGAAGRRPDHRVRRCRGREQPVHRGPSRRGPWAHRPERRREDHRHRRHHGVRQSSFGPHHVGRGRDQPLEPASPCPRRCVALVPIARAVQRSQRGREHGCRVRSGPLDEVPHRHRPPRSRQAQFHRDRGAARVRARGRRQRQARLAAVRSPTNGRHRPGSGCRALGHPARRAGIWIG